MNSNHDVRVSVIVAIYNAEKYLKQCLESIANQTLKDIEIICVNDGSTDNSLEIAEEFAQKDKRFRVYTKENEGLGGASARNYGLDRACGRYISILDSDDFFETDMLEKAYERAEATDADIVMFGGYEYDSKNGSVKKVASILNEKFLPDKEVFSYKDCLKYVYQLSSGMAWNKLYRRSFLEKRNIRFQRIKYTDDVYFTYSHVVLAERITAIKLPLCYYRTNTGTNQTSGLANYPDSAYGPYLALKKSLIDWGIYEEVKQSFVNCAITFMRYFYDRVDRFDAFEYLHKKYCDEIFDRFEVGDKDKDYFYDERVYAWYRQVKDNSAGELAFKAMRAYGTESTAILRFLFPYDKIPGGSRIVIVGADVMGRQYYSQVVLNNYCDVVMWAAKDNSLSFSYVKNYDDLKALEDAPDYALITTTKQAETEEAVSLLKAKGMQEERIIFGGIN